MTLASRVSDLRQLQRNAETMARLSPFKADRDRFGLIAERYRKEADTLEQNGLPTRGVLAHDARCEKKRARRNGD